MQKETTEDEETTEEDVLEEEETTEEETPESLLENNDIKANGAGWNDFVLLVVLPPILLLLTSSGRYYNLALMGWAFSSWIILLLIRETEVNRLLSQARETRSETKCGFCLMENTQEKTRDIRGQIEEGVLHGIGKAVVNYFLGKDPSTAILGGTKKAFEKKEKLICGSCRKDWLSELDARILYIKNNKEIDIEHYKQVIWFYLLCYILIVRLLIL